MSTKPELPREIFTNTETRDVYVTSEIEAALPGVMDAFAAADENYKGDPVAYLKNLESSVYEFKSSEGNEVACSLLYDAGSKPDEALVVFAPFSDSAPVSSAEDLLQHIESDEPGNLWAKEKAAPNSWNQTTKSAVFRDVLGALGENRPVLTIYSPVPPRAYGRKERGQIKNGHFAPAARLTDEAIREAEIRMHGYRGDTKVRTVHISGASLGASNAIGAAAGLLAREYRVPTLTAQELIMGPEGLYDLAKRFTVSQHVGEVSLASVIDDAQILHEPALRRDVDKHGSEPIGMNRRMVQGMRPTYMRGLTHPEPTAEALRYVLESGTATTIALAENSALTHQTPSHLPGAGEQLISIRAERGQTIGHMADEHVALSAIVVALGTRRAAH